jgi:hypothetical protein
LSSLLTTLLVSPWTWHLVLVRISIVAGFAVVRFTMPLLVYWL